MPSEYDALLEAPDTRKQSEYDALLAPPASKEPSTTQKIISGVNEAVGVVQKGQQMALNPVGMLTEKLVPEDVNKFMRTGLISPKMMRPITEASMLPVRGLSEILFGKEASREPLRTTEKALSELTSSQTSPENLGILAGTAGLGAAESILAKRAPNLGEILFGTKAAPEAMPQIPETPISDAVQPQTQIQGGIENAQQIISPTQVYGNVQYAPRPQESVGEVPANIGSEGVQARGQGETLQQTPQEVAPTVPQPEQPIETGASPVQLVPKAEAPTTTAPLPKEEIAPKGQAEPVVPSEKVQSGEFGQKGYTAIPTEKPPIQVTDTQPHVSKIANRFIDERVSSGELGEVAPGSGFSTRELAQYGLRMSPEEINQHISDLVNKTGDPIKQGMAVRAEEARLSQRNAELSRIAEANPKDLEAKVAADNAFKDVTDFHNGPVAQLKQNFHAQGMALQGDIPVDLSTFNGLREKWLKDTGEAPPQHMENTMRKTAQDVRDAVEAENGANQRLSQDIERAASRRKLPTVDEVSKNIQERMKVEPCIT